MPPLLTASATRPVLSSDDALTFSAIYAQSGTDCYLHSHVRDGRALSDAKRVLVMHHGIGEHGGRYTDMAARLLAAVPALDAFLTYDSRGHGETAAGGSACKVESVSQLASDFGVVLQHWRDVCHPDARFILAGRMWCTGSSSSVLSL